MGCGGCQNVVIESASRQVPPAVQKEGGGLVVGSKTYDMSISNLNTGNEYAASMAPQRQTSSVPQRAPVPHCASAIEYKPLPCPATLQTRNVDHLFARLESAYPDSVGRHLASRAIPSSSHGKPIGTGIADPAKQSEVGTPGKHVKVPTAPTVGLCPLPVDERDSAIPNRFMRELYTKYPFLIPKELPPTPDALIRRGYTHQFEYLTTYQEKYGQLGPPLPELVGARGLSLPERDPPTVRLPGTPYPSRSRHPLPADAAVDIQWIREDKKKTSTMARDKPIIPPRISEYMDNISSPARIWKKRGVYSEPEVCIKRKRTLPY